MLELYELPKDYILSWEYRMLRGIAVCIETFVRCYLILWLVIQLQATAGKSVLACGIR